MVQERIFMGFWELGSQGDKIAARIRRKNDPEGQKARMLRFLQKKEIKKEEVAGRKKPDTCDICQTDGAKGGLKRIVFDHCHSTGLFRGWICDRCNKVLGHVHDNPMILLKMALYLEDFNAKTNDEKKKKSS